MDGVDSLMDVEVLDGIEIDLIDEQASKENEAEQKRLRFIEIFENIANIELPCALWGAHIDTQNYHFIAFSKFDSSQMQCTKVLRITDTFLMDVRVDGVSRSTTSLTELSIDIIADAIRSLDEDTNEIV